MERNDQDAPQGFAADCRAQASRRIGSRGDGCASRDRICDGLKSSSFEDGGAPHRYVITVHALDIGTLQLAATSPGAMAGFMINSHSLAKASVTGHFGR